MCAHGQPEFAQYRPSGSFLTGIDVMKRHPVVTEGHPKGVEGVCACATGRCAMSALVGPFLRKCPLGCSIGRPRPISSMATGTSPFTGYLPLSRHFIFIITFLTKVCCFRICCVVIQGCPRCHCGISKSQMVHLIT